MESILLKIIGFIIVTGVLVTVHEFGHFWVARRLGVKVLRFSVGFGKPLYKWQGRPALKSVTEPGTADLPGSRTKAEGTEYVIAAIPLGGYVKMLDEREGEVPQHELDQAFNRQSLWARTAIVAAGPVFNLVFAVIAFWAVLVLGEVGLRSLVGQVETASVAHQAGLRAGDEIILINGRETPTWTRVLYEYATASVSGDDIELQVLNSRGDPRRYMLESDAIGDFAESKDPLGDLGLTPDRPRLPPVLGTILPGEAADSAGLKAGDRIVTADGVTIVDWLDWVKYVRERPGVIIKLVVERAGQEVLLDLIPAPRANGDQTIGRIGAATQQADDLWEKYRVHYSLGAMEAIPVAIEKTWDFSILTLKVMWRIITGQASLKNLGGPLTVADAAGYAVSVGLVQFLKLLAIISVSLGVLNLLPIPVLDGGHLFYFLLEAIRGKPLSEKVLLQGQQIGLMLLLALMALVLYQDISRLIT